MLHREIIAVCSQIHTQHINTAVWAERRNVECLKYMSTYSYPWTSKTCILCATLLVLFTILGNDNRFEDVSSLIPLLPTL